MNRRSAHGPAGRLTTPISTPVGRPRAAPREVSRPANPLDGASDVRMQPGIELLDEHLSLDLPLAARASDVEPHHSTAWRSVVLEVVRFTDGYLHARRYGLAFG